MVIRLLLLAAVVLFVVLWVRAVIDLLRRADLGLGAKAGWAVGMLVLPFIGLLVYTMFRPSDAEVARRAQVR